MEQSKTSDASGGAIAEWLAEQEAAARGRASDQRPNSTSEHWHRAQAAAYEAAHAYAVVRLKALDSASPATQENWVPAGWKLVPLQPTDKMRHDGYGYRWGSSFDDAYRAMLASAPPAPTPEAGSDLADQYYPQTIWYKEADAVEFVLNDGAHIYRELDHGAALVLDMDTRAVVGFRISSPAAWLNTVAPSPFPPPAEDLAGQGEPVAWAYEERGFDFKWHPIVSMSDPGELPWVRNIRPLFAAPASTRPADRSASPTPPKA